MRSYGATNNFYQQYPQYNRRYRSRVVAAELVVLAFLSNTQPACTFNPQGDIFAWLNTFLTNLHMYIRDLIASHLPAGINLPPQALNNIPSMYGRLVDTD